MSLLRPDFREKLDHLATALGRGAELMPGQISTALLFEDIKRGSPDMIIWCHITNHCSVDMEAASTLLAFFEVMSDKEISEVIKDYIDEYAKSQSRSN